MIHGDGQTRTACDAAAAPVALWRLTWVFFRIGAVAFGGGYAMLPLLEAELSDRRQWFSREHISELYALAQTVPGVIAINVAALLGSHLRGPRGALAAAGATGLPAFLVILLIAILLPELRENRLAAYALWGIRPAVVALIARAAYRIGRLGLVSIPALTAFCAALMLMLSTTVNPVIPILYAALTGMLIAILAPDWTERVLKATKGEST